MYKWLPLAVVGLLVALAMAACSAKAKTPEPIERIVTVQVTVPVVQTQVVVETRVAPQTVVVTATPAPTPAYTSRIQAPADTLSYPISGEPSTISPQEASDDVSALVAQQLYEGLFNLRADGTTVPTGATGYEASSDGRAYTVTLRAEAVWSDGKPVTAQHFVDGVCRALDPATGNNYYYLLTDIAQVAGAEDFALGNTADCAKVGIKAVDDLTLEISLARPASFFPKLLTMQIFFPARIDITQTVAGGLISNGPYTLAERVPGERLALRANPTYWNAGQVGLQRVEFNIVANLVDQFARYQQGELMVAEFPGEETPKIMADPLFAKELRVLVQPGASYIGLNTQTGPTENVAFRKAIASAIDRKKLIEEIQKQRWHVPAQSVVPPDIPGSQANDPTVGFPYNPEAARKFLAEAGYGPDQAVPPVELWFNREGNNEPIFKAIAAMLEQIGIPVRLNASSWTVYREALDACNKPNHANATRSPAECNYNAYRMGWLMDYADASAMLNIVFSPRSAFQYAGWQSRKYSDLMVQALVETDEAKRTELYRAAEKVLLNEEVAIVPLQYYDRTLLVKDGLEYDYPSFGAPNLQYWRRTK